MRIYLLSIIICGLFDFANTLQIFGGTSTEITCSAVAPSFSLQLIGQEIEYESYDEFPGLFDITARQLLSPTGNKAILYINGTNRSNNVTIICRNYNFLINQFHILFRLILEFIDILPAPNDVHYIDPEDIPGYLQILWEPPTLDSYELDSQNDSVKQNARIINYTVYIATEESTIIQVYNASGTSFAIGIDKIPCSFWFQVAAVNPAGVGERSPSQNLTFDSHTGCTSSTSSTVTTIIDSESIPAAQCHNCMDSTHTTMIIENLPSASGSSAWAISATTISALLAVVCIILAACLFTLLKMYRNGMNRHSKTAENTIEMKQNEVYGIHTRPL